jgi:hypothetical protein
VDRNNWAVNWELFEVWAAVAVDLGIEVREDTALKERIVAKVDTANNVAGLELFESQSDIDVPPQDSTHHDLLSLGKVICRVSVQGQLAEFGDRNKFLRNDFGGIQNVEAKLKLVFFINDLDAEL